MANFCSPNELVALVKGESLVGMTKSKLHTANDLQYIVQSLSSSGGERSARCVVQKYIKSIGSKAFKVRTFWSRDKPPFCFIVTNKSSYYEYDGVPDYQKYMVVPDHRNTGTMMFKTNKGKQLADTVPYCENIVKYFRGSFRAEVLSLAADFIKDESGIWWLINVKRIELLHPISLTKISKFVKGDEEYGAVHDDETNGHKRPEGYQKIKLCRYCEEPYHSEELTKKMTLKMAIELDKHLKYRGYRYDWLNRSERQFLDTSNLYEVHQVCKIW